jgi:hypothetical protein
MNPARSLLETSIDGYKLYDGASVPTEGVIMSALKSIQQQPTFINSRFFNRKNVDYLQKIIAGTVQKRIGMRIDRQSDDELLILMRAVYLENSAVNYDDVQGEVARLNDEVVAKAVPIVSSNVLQYVTYLRDASTMPVMLSGPQSTSIKGTKTLNMVSQML